MEVGRLVQGLAPGLQDAKKADLGASVLGITGNRLQRLGHGLKEQTIHQTRMLQGEGTELGGKGKDDMTVGHLQELTRASRKPGRLSAPLALGAVPIAAGVVADCLVATAIALGCVAPQAGGAARRDGLEDPPLRRRGYGAIAGQIVRPILADHLGDFKVGAGPGCLSWRGSQGKVSSGLGIAVSAWGVTCR
jgi:hypothetical protein